MLKSVRRLQSCMPPTAPPTRAESALRCATCTSAASPSPTLCCPPRQQGFKYLGVYFTLTLDWSHQRSHAKDLLRTMVEQLGEAPASATTALRIECQSILGKLRHTFCVAPYTQTHLDGFDRIRANAVRRAYRLPKRFPTDAIFASHDNFGMGHPSATVEYVAAVLKHMFEALNDSGRLGTLARAMMHSVLHDRGHQPPPPPQPPEQAPPPPPADPPPESAGAPELQSSPDTQGYFADLFAEPDAQAQAPPPPPPPPPPPQPPSDRICGMPRPWPLHATSPACLTACISGC